MNDSTEHLDWADVRIFLAVADGGTLGAAAERLGLSQPTVGRRIAALEDRFETHLFARTARRMHLTDAGNAILESARVMRREMDNIHRRIAGEAKGLSGVVTITATEGTGSEWLIPVLESLRRAYPDIEIRLQIDMSPADLLAREADIALRLGEPTQPDLISRKLADIGFGIYAEPGFLKAHGTVDRVGDLQGGAWVQGAFGGPYDMLTMFTGEHRLEHRVSLSTNNPTAQIAAVAAGIGFGLLSHRWAAGYPNLVRVLPELPVVTIPLWLLTHEDLRHSARIRAVADHIIARAEADRDLFAHGQRAPVS